MENQKTPSSLEEFLFGFTRLFAIGGALIGLIAVALLIIKLSSPGESTYVALEDIKTTGSTKSNTVAEASAKPSKKLIIPENVKKYTSEKDEKVKQSWLDGIDGQDKKQDFLTNMSQVIADTESKKVDIITVMNSYRTLKLSKLNKS